jgi:hypothetical protein
MSRLVPMLGKTHKSAIKKLKKNKHKIAGMHLSYNKDKSGHITKITLVSPNTWTLEKIKKILSTLKKKYKKIDKKDNIKKYSIDEVKSIILDHHNGQKRVSQSAYDKDMRNAKPIKNLESIYTFTNEGDRITTTITTCLQGKENTNLALNIMNIHDDKIKIEYVSKKVVEKENKEKNNAQSNKRKKEQEESNEMDAL